MVNGQEDIIYVLSDIKLLSLLRPSNLDIDIIINTPLSALENLYSIKPNNINLPSNILKASFSKNENIAMSLVVIKAATFNDYPSILSNPIQLFFENYNYSICQNNCDMYITFQSISPSLINIATIEATTPDIINSTCYDNDLSIHSYQCPYLTNNEKVISCKGKPGIYSTQCSHPYRQGLCDLITNENSLNPIKSSCHVVEFDVNYYASVTCACKINYDINHHLIDIGSSNSISQSKAFSYIGMIDNTTKHYTDVFTNIGGLDSVTIINSHGVIYLLGFFIAGFIVSIFIMNIIDIITYQKDNYYKIYKQNIEIEKQNEQQILIKNKEIKDIKDNKRQIKNYSSPNISSSKLIISSKDNEITSMTDIDNNIRTPTKVHPTQSLTPLTFTPLSVGKISLSPKTPPSSRPITKRPISNNTNGNNSGNNDGNSNEKRNFTSQALITTNNNSNLSIDPFILNSIEQLDEDQQNKFNNEVIAMKLKFDKSLPNIFRSYTPFFLRCCREMALHHKWISIFVHYSIDYPRYVRITIIISCFIYLSLIIIFLYE